MQTSVIKGRVEFQLKFILVQVLTGLTALFVHSDFVFSLAVDLSVGVQVWSWIHSVYQRSCGFFLRKGMCAVGMGTETRYLIGLGAKL